MKRQETEDEREKREMRDFDIRYCPWNRTARYEGVQIVCDLGDCEIYNNESDACSIRLGALALDRIGKIFETVQPVMSGNSELSKGAHEALIPFALDLCESEIQEIKRMKCKTYDSLTAIMRRIFANLQIANAVVGMAGYGNKANKDRYRTVSGAFLALQKRHGLEYNNDLI